MEELAHKPSFDIADWIKPCKMKWRWWPLAIGLGYILTISLLGGLRSDHVVIGTLSLLDYYNQKTRAFLSYFLPFILTGVAYDSMRYYYWPIVTQRPIHVADVYQRDLSWFGITVDGLRVTPNELFQKYHWPAVDLLCGFAYLTFIGEYLFTGFYLFFTNNLRLLRGFGWCFFCVNVVGYSVYYIYPAAPPWYITKYGFGPARFDVHSESASAVRFDQILGTHFFDQIYGRGVDVYGAYPSLHVAYPLLVTWVTCQVPNLKFLRIPALCFYFLMCFSAVYLQHHFVVDIIFGTLLASAGALMTSYLVKE